jgi:hypothetical protein
MLGPVAFSAGVFQSVEVPLDLLRRAPEVEIILIETGDLLQLLDIEQGEPTVRQPNELVPPEPLQDAVDVHGGQAQGVGEFELGQRQPDRVILAQSDRPLPPHQLAQQISDAPACAPPPKRDDALAVDRLLLQRAPPQRVVTSGLRARVMSAIMPAPSARM